MKCFSDFKQSIENNLKYFLEIEKAEINILGVKLNIILPTAIKGRNMGYDCPNCGHENAYFNSVCYECPDCGYEWGGYDEDDDEDE
jgi:peptide subunit release factor 1 (eRF1)